MVPEASISSQQKQVRTIYHLFKLALEGTKGNVGDFITQPPLVVSNIQRSSAITYPGVLDMVISTPEVAQLEDDLLKLWEEKKPIPNNLRQSLAEALRSSSDKYDFIPIDCPPGLSIFSSTALVASDYFVSPIIPEPLSLQGVQLVLQSARNLKSKYSAKMEFKGVVLNVVKHYRNTHRTVAELVYSGAAPFGNPAKGSPPAS